MQTEQLALLVALVVLANVALLGALAAPRWQRARLTNDRLPAPDRGAVEAPPRAAPLGGTSMPNDLDAAPGSRSVYDRVVRVVSYVFLGSALVVVTVSGASTQPLVYLLLAAGAFLIVLGQDMLPMALLGRWRFSLEISLAIIFVTALIVLTGGFRSPFFFGYVLLLAGASLRAEGAGPVLLAIATGGAYLVGITLAPSDARPSAAEVGLVGFNLVSLALIAFVAAVLGGEQRRAREAALRLSRFDQLTGVYSRMYFNSALQQEILRAVRTGRPFSLLMMDLDGLKPVNDRFGHEFGDRLLRSVGDVVRRGIRLTDIAARYGGDEFVVILPETDLDGAIRVSEKLRLDIAELSVPHDRTVIQTSVSIGLVTYPQDGRTGSELMRRADHAMYEAKRRGRNQIVHYPRPAQRREQRPRTTHSPAAMGPGRTAWPQVPPGDAARPVGGPVPAEDFNGSRAGPPAGTGVGSARSIDAPTTRATPAEPASNGAGDQQPGGESPREPRLPPRGRAERHPG